VREDVGVEVDELKPSELIVWSHWKTTVHEMLKYLSSEIRQRA
jgi:uncharacterized cupin superfamily protein